jgi:hypothetical protein
VIWKISLLWIWQSDSSFPLLINVTKKLMK